MSELRNRMIQEMELRRLSANTQEAYLRAVKQLAAHFGRSPDGVTKKDLRGYVHYLLTERRLSPSSVDVAAAGLRFFYSETLGRKWMMDLIPPRKKPSRLPEVLSTEEVSRLFAATKNLKHRLLLMTTYGAGLRVSEVVRLRPVDIEAHRMMIRVRQGKGEKDRYTILSPRLYGAMRTYWNEYRPGQWLFPGSNRSKPLCYRSASRVYADARDQARIRKGRGLHTLRHCFATHLLEAGVDVRTIQLLMGHHSIRTTVGYIHLTSKRLGATSSPLDLLDLEETKLI